LKKERIASQDKLGRHAVVFDVEKPHILAGPAKFMNNSIAFFVLTNFKFKLD
jgi:hypothetical protein